MFYKFTGLLWELLTCFYLLREKKMRPIIRVAKSFNRFTHLLPAGGSIEDEVRLTQEGGFRHAEYGKANRRHGSKGREITDAAQLEKVQTEKDIVKKREDIRAEYLERARHRIAMNEPQERAAAEEA